MIELGDHNFDQCIQKGFWVVDFWSPSCAPCRVVSPILADLALELKDVHFGAVDATTELRTRFSHQVNGLPTVMIFKDGRPVDLLLGAHPARLYRRRITDAWATYG